MCGIAGTASRHFIADRAWLARGCEAMRHRGPDDEGEWWSADGRAGFGFRRLAIIDLTSGGHQPMEDRANELSVVFNGEIYNFASLREELSAHGVTFRSRSDTEVLLAAYARWGTDCVARLNGMFAFALYDGRTQRLFLARDRAGKKPLFYRESHGEIRFASELKAILADPAIPRRIDPEALDCYLAMGYAAGERCILEGIRKLPPAHALLFDLNTGTIRTWRYWSLPSPRPSPGETADEEALTRELDRLLESAVRDRLVADVPVGVMLSGGVDSSLITAMAARARDRVRTYCVRFPGAGAFDETRHARLIANHFGTDHVELEAAETSLELLPALASQYDEPIIDSSMIPTYLVSRAIRQHCTVALGGDGGDELFGGYAAYDRLLRMQRTFESIPRAVRQPVAAAAGAILPVGFKGRNWLRAMSADLGRELPMVGVIFDPAARRSLLGGDARWRPSAEQVYRDRVPAGVDLLDRATRMDFENYLAEDILVKVDRASMLTSLEVRAPLLDVRIVEFAFSRVPSSLKASASRRKILLKALAARVLPPAFDQQRKQGFSIPLDSWLQSTAWQQFFRDVLLDRSQTHFDRTFIGGLLDAQRRGRRNGERLFGLVMFELWRREYGVAF